MRLWASLLLVVVTAPLVAQEPLERIVFGSCNEQDKPQKFWDAILAMKPQVFLFCGDNIYGDTKDMDVLRKKYQQLADEPGYKALKQACPILATWDDHDYGVNDGGKDYPKRDESQQIFLDFFGVPKDSPRRKLKGVYNSAIFGPADKSVQIIMTDTRYDRGPFVKRGKFIPNLGPYIANNDKTSTFLTEDQWQWLEGELRKPAKVRLLVSSIQVVSEDHGWEKWMNLPHERERLFKLLRDTGAAGVVILSGDRHHAELSVMDAGLGYPLFDLTSSGLNQGFAKWRMPENNKHRNSVQFSGNNFGDVLIDWSGTDPILRLQIRRDDGEISISERVPLSVLQPGFLKIKDAPVAKAGVVTLDGKPLTAELAKELKGKEVTLRMKVVASGMSKTGDLVFLNSSTNRMADDNFTVVLNKTVQGQLKAAGIANPKSHYDGKSIEVVGPLSEFGGRPQIVVAAAEKIKLAE